MEYHDIISMAYSGDGPGKLGKAKQLFQQYGIQLLAQKTITESLAVLRDANTSLESHMVAMNMGKSCSGCALLPDGGCCSAYMGHENNDAIQLLMNLLAGVDVRMVRIDDIECGFLAETGCILLFKPIFCLNYLCERIQKESKQSDLKILEEKTGYLLGLQVALEQNIITQLH
jgi:hypothetical protein